MPAIYSYCKDGIIFNHVYDIDSSQDPFLIISKNGNNSKFMLDQYLVSNTSGNMINYTISSLDNILITNDMVAIYPNNSGEFSVIISRYSIAKEYNFS